MKTIHLLKDIEDNTCPYCETPYALVRLDAQSVTGASSLIATDPTTGHVGSATLRVCGECGRTIVVR